MPRSWFDEQGFSAAGTERAGQPVPGQPGFVYNTAGGIEPVDGTPNGPGEITSLEGVSQTKPVGGMVETGGVTGGGNLPSGATGNRQADIMPILQKYPHTPAGLKQAEAEIKALYPNAKIMGSKGDKIDFGDGEVVDAIISAGTGGTGWSWQSSKDAAPDGADAFGYTDGSLLTPYTEQFTNPYGDVPAYGAPDQLAAPAPFAYEAFKPQTPFSFSLADFTKDPGYDFRLKQGTDSLQQSQAAKGLLRAGGSLKDILGYGQEFASNEFDNAYGRAANTWGMNDSSGRANYQTGYDAAANTYGTNTNTTMNTFDRNVAARNAGYDRQVDAYNTNYGNRLGEFVDRRNQFWGNQNNQFNRLSSLANMGR